MEGDAGPAPIGVVTGLLDEQRILERTARRHGLPVSVRCAGADPGRAAAAAEQLAASGVTCLVSFGLAGGLDPALLPGRLVLADRIVLSDGAVLATHEGLATRLSNAATGIGLRLVRGAIAGSDRPVATASAKMALAGTSGAIAVDMESHAVARVANATGIPFIVLRAVADPATFDVPAAALSGVDTAGRTRPMAVIARLARRPRDIPALIALAEAAARGRRGLIAVAPLIGALVARIGPISDAPAPAPGSSART